METRAFAPLADANTDDSRQRQAYARLDRPAHDHLVLLLTTEPAYIRPVLWTPVLRQPSAAPLTLLGALHNLKITTSRSSCPVFLDRL